MKIAFIDHYDSFSNNLIDWITEEPFTELIRVFHDDFKTIEKLRQTPIPTVLSPGPNSPHEVPSSCQYLLSNAGKIPILGICLGHQILAHCFGGTISRSDFPLHGAVKTVIPSSQTSLFDGKINPIKVGVYNSLIIKSPGPNFKVAARCGEGEIQAIESIGWSLPTWGVQFHPESFLSDNLSHFRRSWFALAKQTPKKTLPISMMRA